jgi:hypothetical protein
VGREEDVRFCEQKQTLILYTFCVYHIKQ